MDRWHHHHRRCRCCHVAADLAVRSPTKENFQAFECCCWVLLCFYWLLIWLWILFIHFFMFYFFLFAWPFVPLWFVCGPREGLEAVQKELKDDEALPKLLVFGIALIGLGLLIANTALVAWFIIRKRIKGKNNMKLIFCCVLARQSSDFCFILSLFSAARTCSIVGSRAFIHFFRTIFSSAAFWF